MPFTVYDGLIQAFQLDSFGTLGIEVTLFTLLPSCLATVFTVQPAIVAVMAKPVVGLRSAGYPIHHSFGKRLMTIISLGCGKGEYYIVE
jgi:hypothetical protein